MKISKVFFAPFLMLFAKLNPVGYARYIGVTIKGAVKIYGSSYSMFSAEPYLVTLGDNVYISLNAKFICHDGAVLPFRKQFPDLDIAARIEIKDNVFIGMGACILPGVTIGANSIVGAYAVISKDVPDGCVVAGNPARIVKSSEDYLASVKKRSLHIGHLYGKEKIRAYKSIFHI